MVAGDVGRDFHIGNTRIRIADNYCKKTASEVEWLLQRITQQAQRQFNAAAAAGVYEQEQDTKLLLRNYRRLNAYYENAIFSIEDAEEADESFEDIMRNMGRPADEEIFVESIQKNYLATRIIMTHVNKMLDCYEIMCERSNRQDDKRHWRVLEGLYLSENYTTAEQIAKQEHIDKRTVYNDIDVCAADLTALFFGVGGIERLGRYPGHKAG